MVRRVTWDVEPTPKPRKPRRRKRPLWASGLNDFRPGVDHVVRHEDGFGYVHDSQGLYEPVRVDDDALTDRVKANLDKLTPEQAAIMFRLVQDSPFLSPEGRHQRLQYLLRSRKVRLRFTVDGGLGEPVEPDVWMICAEESLG